MTPSYPTYNVSELLEYLDLQGVPQYDPKAEMPCNGATGRSVSPATQPPLPDADRARLRRVLELACENDNDFARLAAGGPAGFPSDSEADLSFANILALLFCGDPAKVDAAFRLTARMRDKWNRCDYRTRTIGLAVEHWRKHCIAITPGVTPATAEPVNKTPDQMPPHMHYEQPAEDADRESQTGDKQAEETKAPPAAQKEVKASQASNLIKLASSMELFHSSGKKAYASYSVNGHREVCAVKSSTFKLHVQGLYYRTCHTAITSKALADGLGVLEAKALYDGAEHPVFMRVGEHNGEIYIDPGTDKWSAIRISARGWEITPTHPEVRFVRSNGMLPMPRPVHAHDALKQFQKLTNIASRTDFMLLVGWLIAAMRPAGPYPILAFRSAHGNGKSTLSRMCRALLDPSEAPLRTLPRDEQDFAIAAIRSWIAAFDNVSSIPHWLSDALCRLSTGGGFGTRALYTNDEEVLLAIQRPTLINGIVEVLSRPDLLDRSIHVEPALIAEHNRVSERELWATFNQLAPGVLAVLLDGVSEALKNIGDIEIPNLPRMADFVLWVEAAAPAFGWERGEFLAAYSENQAQSTVAALSSSPAMRHVRELRNWTQEMWEGTATELLDQIDKKGSEVEKRHPEWPRTPRAMSNLLRRYLPNLREIGLEVVFDRENSKNRERVIRLKGIGPLQTTLFGQPQPEYPD